MNAVDERVAEVPVEVERAIGELLIHEARLLDERRFDDWLALLADDMTYRMPVRVTADLRSGSDVVEEMSYFEEDRQTLTVRLSRFGTNSAWAEDPPSRTRHFVSNVQVEQGPSAGELRVTSYLMFTRCRGSNPVVDILTGLRADAWRADGSGWLLAERRVYLDQSVLGTLNLSTIY